MHAIASALLWSLTSFFVALDELQSTTWLEESMQAPTEAGEEPPLPHAARARAGSVTIRQIDARMALPPSHAHGLPASVAGSDHPAVTGVTGVDRAPAVAADRLRREVRGSIRAIAGDRSRGRELRRLRTGWVPRPVEPERELSRRGMPSSQGGRVVDLPSQRDAGRCGRGQRGARPRHGHG